MKELLSAPLSSRKLVEYLLLFLLLASILSAAAYGGYWYGKQQVKPSQKAAPKTKEPSYQESADEMGEWKAYIGETTYTTDGSSKFSIWYPSEWVREGSVLYPKGKGSGQEVVPSIVLGAGGHGAPGPAEDKPYPAGTAKYYWEPDESGQYIIAYASFSVGNLAYIFEPENIPASESKKYEKLFNRMLSTFRFLDQEVAEETAEETVGWKTFKNENKLAAVRYSLRYPSEWELEHEEGPRGAGYDKTRDAAILARGAYKIIIYQDETIMTGGIPCQYPGDPEVDEFYKPTVTTYGNFAELNLAGKSARRAKPVSSYQPTEPNPSWFYVCEKKDRCYSLTTSFGEITYVVPEGVSDSILREMDLIITTLRFLDQK